MFFLTILLNYIFYKGEGKAPINLYIDYYQILIILSCYQYLYYHLLNSQWTGLTNELASFYELKGFYSHIANFYLNALNTLKMSALKIFYCIVYVMT